MFDGPESEIIILPFYYMKKPEFDLRSLISIEILFGSKLTIILKRKIVLADFYFSADNYDNLFT